MATLRVGFSDNNYGEDYHNIYRATSPMDPLNLPAPLDTAPANTTEYLDTSAVVGTTYYYRVGAVIGAEEAVSEEASITAPTVTFSDDFSSGDLSKWDTSDTRSVYQYVAPHPVTGSPCLVTKNASPVASGVVDEVYGYPVNPPADYKPTEFYVDIYIAERGSDDVGLVNLQDGLGGNRTAFGIIAARQYQDSSQRRMYLGVLTQTAITLELGRTYRFRCFLDWATGEATVKIEGLTTLTVPFDNTRFPVTLVRVYSQTSGTVGVSYIDNISLV